MAVKKKLFWQLFPSYLLITIISLTAVAWYASSAIRDFYIDQTVSDLEARARLFEERIAEHMDPLDVKTIDRLAKNAGKRTSTRFTVILPTGLVAGDSLEDPATMDNHADRPEFLDALKDNRGVSLRHSITLDKDLMYVAVPMKRGSQNIAVVRASFPISAVDNTVRSIQLKVLFAGLIMAIFSAVLSLVVSRRITGPIEQIRKWAESIAKGAGSMKMERPKPSVHSAEEIEGLSESLSRMAEELRRRIEQMARQQNEMKAVFSSMIEGVMAFDMEERILSMNQAAAEILKCDLSTARGRNIQEVVRNTALHQFVSDTLSARDSIEADIPTIPDGEGLLNGHGTILRDESGTQIGALVVLNDVSRLRRLENIRRDFVSNVSHEIKTPITAIKGYVETLRDGAMEKPEDTERFLGIIKKHVDRLEAIIEDLLNLSKIEQESEKTGISFVDSRILDILQNALQVCHVAIADKKMEVETFCADSIKASVDPTLLEQAIVNLLDNAIKYSDIGGTIRLAVSKEKDSLVIAVQDHGCGISEKHLPRLFERFYRVDKARSRQLGGTGLGLAIVKHIVQAHGGDITVESTPGKGSTFSIWIPAT
ncbi:MAG: PAS domain-containing protein [Deltaproteobacteria bacterium]|nr:PAS domain-containing protein [Deltaproteobacteria bacterium]